MRFLFSQNPLDRLDALRHHPDQMLEKSQHSRLAAIVECDGGYFLCPEGDTDLGTLQEMAETQVILGQSMGVLYLALQIPAALKADYNWQEFRAMAAQLDPELASVAGFARSILAFHRHNPFCAKCGHPTHMTQGGLARKCGHENCQRDVYPRVDPAVLIMITHHDQVLLHRQSHWPLGQYSILAGFAEVGETLEGTVIREAFEEAGVRVSTPQYVASQPWPFYSQLMIGFRAEALSTGLTPDSCEIESLCWFSKQDIKAQFHDQNRGTETGLCLPQQGSLSRAMLDKWLYSAA